MNRVSANKERITCPNQIASSDINSATLLVYRVGLDCMFSGIDFVDRELSTVGLEVTRRSIIGWEIVLVQVSVFNRYKSSLYQIFITAECSLPAGLESAIHYQLNPQSQLLFIQIPIAGIVNTALKYVIKLHRKFRTLSAWCLNLWHVSSKPAYYSASRYYSRYQCLRITSSGITWTDTWANIRKWS